MRATSRFWSPPKVRSSSCCLSDEETPHDAHTGVQLLTIPLLPAHLSGSINNPHIGRAVCAYAQGGWAAATYPALVLGPFTQGAAVPYRAQAAAAPAATGGRGASQSIQTEPSWLSLRACEIPFCFSSVPSALRALSKP